MTVILLDLPDLMIEQILGFVSYDEISKFRLVCRRIDKICQNMLNMGFNKMIKRHSRELKRIKSLLPRRESERRNHPLVRHADILTCIETRISMLTLTYTKYIDLNLCCFIPGKVIDEVFRILYFIKTTTKPLRTHEVLQELRDISSMAIEHFDDQIVGILKRGFVDTSCVTQTYSNISNNALDDIITLAAEKEKETKQQQRACTSKEFEVDLNKVVDNNSITKCPHAVHNRRLLQKLEDKFNYTLKQCNLMSRINRKQAQEIKENKALLRSMNSKLSRIKRRLEEVDEKHREVIACMLEITASEGNPKSKPVSSKPEYLSWMEHFPIGDFRKRISHTLTMSEDHLNSKKPKLDGP